MQFLLDEIVARVVAIYLFIGCSREIRDGLVEGKINTVGSDLVSLLLWPNVPQHVWKKDASSIGYWSQIGLRAVAWICCLVVAIFGWWRPAS